MKKQFLAKLLVLAMVLTMVPAMALVASANTAAGTNNDPYYSIADDTKPGINVAPSQTVTKPEASAVSSNGTVKVEVSYGVGRVEIDAKVAEKLVSNAKNGFVTLKVEADGAGRLVGTLDSGALAAVVKSGNGFKADFGNIATVTITKAALSKLTGELQVSVWKNTQSKGFEVLLNGKDVTATTGISVEYK